MIGVISDPLFMNHETGSYHPEAPMRIHYIHTVFNGKEPGIMMVEPVKASPEDIMLNHEQYYVDQVLRSCSAQRLVDLDPDTVCSEDSYSVALYAAGSVIKLVQMALAREIDAGFASVRPPGHHATADEAMGFCLFNNVAIAARKAIRFYGVERVIIVDFDVHHGNGTQESFYDSTSVLYFSTHQYPFYPGTGRLSEFGASGAEGYTVNCPLRGGKNDGQFVAVYKSLLVPIIETFKPGLILVSAGFDAHAMDPIGGMQLSSEGFAALVGIIRDAARKVDAPVVYALEGGYNLNALQDSVRAVIDVIKGGEPLKIEAIPWPELDEALKAHSRYWPL
jgi:acetoin utilization deacetylase AcuC-like enzyme